MFTFIARQFIVWKNIFILISISQIVLIIVDILESTFGFDSDRFG